MIVCPPVSTIHASVININFWTRIDVFKLKNVIDNKVQWGKYCFYLCLVLYDLCLKNVIQSDKIIKPKKTVINTTPSAPMAADDGRLSDADIFVFLKAEVSLASMVKLRRNSLSLSSK